jgi:DNA-binding beta-propeller fold protein YncE
VIDPARSRIVAAIPVGQYPGAIAVGTSGVWVANAGDETVSRIDPKRLVVTKTYGVGGAAADIALDTGGAWVVTGLDHTLVRIDARRGVGPVLPLPATPSGTSSVAVGGGWVWVGSENVLRIDPTAGTIRQAHGCCRSYDLAYGYGAAWVAGRDEVVTKLGPESLRVVASQHVGELELRLALGYGSVWTAGTTNFNASRLSAVWKLDPMTALPSAGFPVGQHPTRGVNYTVSIAVGAGGIWVAPANTRDLVRLDPETGRETARLHLDRQPGGIAVGAGRVWVTLQ